MLDFIHIDNVVFIPHQGNVFICITWRLLQKTIVNKYAELWSLVPVDKFTKYSHL